MPAMRMNLLRAAIAGALTLIAAPAAAQLPCGGGYTVRPGDTLADIATRCATSIPALLSVNPGVRDERDLDAGERLRVPAPGTTPTPVEACGGFYVLRPGDTLDEVAGKCGLTIPLLVAANPSLEDPENVRPGGTVRIPDLPRPGAGIEPVIVGARAADGAAAAGPGGAPFPAAQGDSVAMSAPDEYVRHEGVLRDGRRCTVLRTAAGDVGIVGGLGSGFAAGDRVVVTGPPVADSECGTARAMEVRIMWRPR